MTTCECCGSAFIDYKRTGTKVCGDCTEEASGFRLNADPEMATLIQKALEYVMRKGIRPLPRS